MMRTQELTAVVIGILAGLFTVLLLTTTSAGAVTAEHRVIVGLATTNADITTNWHSPGSNLDLTNNNGATVDANVYWQSRHTSGARGMDATTINHAGYCTGQDIYISDGTTGAALGNYWFVHIHDTIGSGTWFWVAANFNWTLQYIGKVNGASDENADCKNPPFASPTLWTGPHLHQGGDNGAGTAVYTNYSIPDPVNPTGNYSANWMHKYQWTY